jgi:hypothetical protein
MSGPRPAVVFVRPITPDEVAAAVRCVRRHAHDADDILAALGLS